MEKRRLDNYVRGWFIGNFEPSVIKTNDVEVAVKEYSRGEYDPKHYHKKATEITVVLHGLVKMNGEIYAKGDMIIIKPNDISDLDALEDNTITVVVKYPGINNDKYVL